VSLSRRWQLQGKDSDRVLRVVDLLKTMQQARGVGTPVFTHRAKFQAFQQYSESLSSRRWSWEARSIASPLRHAITQSRFLLHFLTSLSRLFSVNSLPDPNSYPIPGGVPGRYGASTPSIGAIGPDDSASQVAWAKRQQGPKRGLTRKVKLTRGHWVVDHRVPTAIKNSAEHKWSSGESGTLWMEKIRDLGS